MPHRRRTYSRELQAEHNPMADAVRVVELLLDGRNADAERYFARAEREAHAAADRQTPRMLSINLSEGE